MIVTDLLTGKRVSRAHIWRMDQILPPELSAFELIGHDKGAQHFFHVADTLNRDWTRTGTWCEAGCAAIRPRRVGSIGRRNRTNKL
jgi:hypothetical protein